VTNFTKHPITLSTDRITGGSMGSVRVLDHIDQFVAVTFPPWLAAQGKRPCPASVYAHVRNNRDDLFSSGWADSRRRGRC